MIRLSLSLTLAVVVSYSTQSAAMIEKVTTSQCDDYREYEQVISLPRAQIRAEIAGSEAALSRVALFCQDKFSALKIGNMSSECRPSYTTSGSRLLCATCLTTVIATCD
jgi:hypothetical protein